MLQRFSWTVQALKRIRGVWAAGPSANPNLRARLRVSVKNGNLGSWIAGSPEIFDLESRTFHVATFIAVVGSVLALTVNLLTGLPLILNILSLFYGVLCAILFYISRTRVILSFLPFMFLGASLIALSIFWFLNGGLVGSIPYIFFIFIYLFIVTNKTELSIWILTLVVANLLGLLVLQQLRPKWLLPYPSDESQFSDMAGALLYVSVLFGAGIISLKQSYDQERLRAEHEREKSDRLLLSILPADIADELKEKGNVKPRLYEQATVLFADIQGFTKIAEQLTPTQIIQELNHCFLTFDEICDRHHLERIKTIGDAYMAAGGIPTPNTTHPLDAVTAALDMQAFMKTFNAEKCQRGAPPWSIRIGIHTGPVIAGVIGKTKFAYDIWGDAVNIASRMETSGEVDRINLSGDTYALVASQIPCEYRGRIHAKNKGEVDMYFVQGKFELLRESQIEVDATAALECQHDCG